MRASRLYAAHCEAADDASDSGFEYFTLEHHNISSLGCMVPLVMHLFLHHCTVLSCTLLHSDILIGSCRGGFCRFSSSRYTLDKANLKNLYMHLTNVAIQKNNEKYDENTGMKWPISKLKQYLLSKYGLAATSKLFGDIQVSLCMHSL